MRTERHRASGFTLIEIMIAVSLVALLSTAMLVAIRVALNSEVRANTRLTENRRVVGAQRAIEQEISGFMPAEAVWTNPSGGTQKLPFFGGDSQTMRFVSSYSLNAANRGMPQLLEFAVIAGDRGQGVRLIVNELPYRGGPSAGARVAGFETQENQPPRPVFFPIVPGPWSFVLADHLAYCRMIFLDQVAQPQPHREWRADWIKKEFPVAVRIEMAPLPGDTALLHPVTVTEPLRAFRDPDFQYVD